MVLRRFVRPCAIGADHRVRTRAAAGTGARAATATVSIYEDTDLTFEDLSLSLAPGTHTRRWVRGSSTRGDDYDLTGGGYAELVYSVAHGSSASTPGSSSFGQCHTQYYRHS